MAKSKLSEEGEFMLKAEQESKAEEPTAKVEQAAPPMFVGDIAVPAVQQVQRELRAMKAAVRWLVSALSPSQQQQFYVSFPSLKEE